MEQITALLNQLKYYQYNLKIYSDNTKAEIEKNTAILKKTNYVQEDIEAWVNAYLDLQEKTSQKSTPEQRQDVSNILDWATGRFRPGPDSYGEEILQTMKEKRKLMLATIELNKLNTQLKTIINAETKLAELITSLEHIQAISYLDQSIVSPHLDKQVLTTHFEELRSPEDLDYHNNEKALADHFLNKIIGTEPFTNLNAFVQSAMSKINEDPKTTPLKTPADELIKELISYATSRGADNTPHYYHSWSAYVGGHSKKEKLDAVTHLLDVFKGKNTLTDKDMEALSRSKLGKVVRKYKDFLNTIIKNQAESNDETSDDKPTFK